MKKKRRVTVTLSNDVIKKIDALVNGKPNLNRSFAIETILNEHLQSRSVKKAVVLGGGEEIIFNGKKIPKLLLPFRNKTLIEYNIGVLKSFGVTEVIFSLGKLGDAVRNKIKDGSGLGVKVMYFERDYGNAWVLRQAKSLLEETFYMMNGDILLENVDLENMAAFHKNSGGKGTMLVVANDDADGLGLIKMKGVNVIQFREKRNKGRKGAYLVNGGVYLFESSICDMVTPDFASLEYNIFPELVKEKSLFGYLMENDWFHLHDEKKYNRYLNMIDNEQK